MTSSLVNMFYIINAVLYLARVTQMEALSIEYIAIVGRLYICQIAIYN